MKLAAGKPIAIGEMAPPPTPETLAAQPRWTWFMPWGDLALLWGGPEHLKVLAGDPQVLAMDDIARDGNGRYTVTTKESGLRSGH